MVAHICQGGDKTKGFIRLYPSFVCSLCMGENAVEINNISEEGIQEYNQKVREKRDEKNSKSETRFRSIS